MIFPEGTRTAPGRAPAYQPGVAALYQALACRWCRRRSIPGCSGGGAALSKRPGRITLEFLDPIPPGLPPPPADGRTGRADRDRDRRAGARGLAIRLPARGREPVFSRRYRGSDRANTGIPPARACINPGRRRSRRRSSLQRGAIPFRQIQLGNDAAGQLLSSCTRHSTISSRQWSDRLLDTRIFEFQQMLDYVLAKRLERMQLAFVPNLRSPRR